MDPVNVLLWMLVAILALVSIIAPIVIWKFLSFWKSINNDIGKNHRDIKAKEIQFLNK